MAEADKESTHQQWAQFRFAVVAPLLASPPGKGCLQAELKNLAEKEWRHPITEEPVRFGFSTIEHWWYQAQKAANPITALRRKTRKDQGRQKSLGAALKKALLIQYKAHRSWSCQLHYDNLAAQAENDSGIGLLPSYSTIVRFMKTKGLCKRRRLANTAAGKKAEARLEQREVRSFEAEHANALWHLDFHHCSRQVLTAKGKWTIPLLPGVIDDHSRLICHVQRYLGESAEELVHGLSQALQKRGLPRAVMMDNGAAMQAEETRQGLKRLSILQEFTLAYSPYQNGKQEVFWTQVEGRLLPMLEGVRELDLTALNEATQAWAEMEYNRKLHSETGMTPTDRFVKAANPGRPCPASETLREAFTVQASRRQRRSDGTITILGVRYEIPSCYKTLSRVTVRYPRWDLSRVHLLDPVTEQAVCRIFPLDKAGNADGRRRAVSSDPLELADSQTDDGPAPLLRNLLAEYAATGLPPAYLAKQDKQGKQDKQDKQDKEKKA